MARLKTKKKKNKSELCIPLSDRLKKLPPKTAHGSHNRDFTLAATRLLVTAFHSEARPITPGRGVSNCQTVCNDRVAKGSCTIWSVCPRPNLGNMQQSLRPYCEVFHPGVCVCVCVCVFLACEDFWRTFDDSFPACAFFFFFLLLLKAEIR